MHDRSEYETSSLLILVLTNKNKAETLTRAILLQYSLPKYLNTAKLCYYILETPFFSLVCEIRREVLQMVFPLWNITHTHINTLFCH